jgi:hypothetical protein
MMAGYSETTLLKKLGIKESSRVALINAPKDFLEKLGPLPEGASIVSASGKPLDFILIFTRSRAELIRKLALARANLSQKGMIWIAWPKKSSGITSDLSFAVVQEAGLTEGVVDTKVCAISDVWSGLRFLIRVKDRVAES